MINRIILLGHVGDDPTTNTVNESKVSKFSLATTEKWKDREGNPKEETTWFNIVFWGGVAGVVESYVKKGSKLYIEGKVKNRSYDDKDGNKRYISEVIGSNLQMLDSKPKEDNAAYSPQNDFI